MNSSGKFVGKVFLIINRSETGYAKRGGREGGGGSCDKTQSMDDKSRSRSLNLVRVDLFARRLIVFTLCLRNLI